MQTNVQLNVTRIAERVVKHFDHTRGCGTLLVDELDAAQCRINRGFPMLRQARRTDTSVVLAVALLTQG